jgi:hypothetical protein
VSGLVADSAGLIQERWADDFSIRSGLVFNKVAGIFILRLPGITAHLAERTGSNDDGRSIAVGGISGRHSIRVVVSI